MQKIIIAAEKPFVSKHLAPFARKHWPDAEITLINVLPYSNFRFKYPHGLTWSDYPFISLPAWRIMPWENWAPHRINEAGNLVPVEMTDETFRAADEVVFACDPDHTGAVAFDTLVRHHFEGAGRTFPALLLHDWRDETITNAFNTMGYSRTNLADLVSFGTAKRYFDWNWNINAMALFGRVFQTVGIPTTAPSISKYSLQLLYQLAGLQEPINEKNSFELMSQWKGTGRYQGEVYQHASFGSAASRMAIFAHLIEAGLLLRHRPSGTGTLSFVIVSPRGHDFLARLHPDCRDPDLPFRLHEWCTRGLEYCKPSIDKYIRTFFGKQKTYFSVINKAL